MIKKLLNLLFGSKDNTATKPASRAQTDRRAKADKTDKSARKVQPYKATSSAPRPTAPKVDEELAWQLENLTPKQLFDTAYEAWKENKYSTSFPLFYALAEREYPEAYAYVGMAYELGEGVGKNAGLMEYYYKMAIEAHQYVGVYRFGPYLRQHARAREARELYERAIEEGWATGDAYYQVGTMYKTGIGGVKDEAKAIQHYKQARKMKNSDAARALAKMNIPEDDEPDNGFNVGLPASALEMTPAELFEQGKANIFAADPNPPLAVAYLKLASSRGHAVAANLLARFFANPKMPIYNETLAKRFSMTATQGMVEQVEKEHDLAWDAGYGYLHGAGCQKNLGAALRCFLIGAAEGNVSCIWGAGLAEQQLNGEEKAFGYFRQAVDMGMAVAMYDLAACYEKGRGTAKDVNAAIEWYERCAQSGCTASAKAQKRLTHLRNLSA